MTQSTHRPAATPAQGSDDSFGYFDLSLSSSSLAASSAGSPSSTLSEIVRRPSARKGKGIQAFRKLAIRASENVAFQKKLSSVRRIFSQAHGINSSELDQASVDVLELTKIDYSDKVRKQALRIILLQVATKNTLHLVHALSNWPVPEICLLMKEIMKCMPRSWLQFTTLFEHEGQTEMLEDLGRTYFEDLGEESSHADGAICLAIFMCQTIASGTSGCHALIEVGFLDFLLALNLLFPQFPAVLMLGPWCSRGKTPAIWDSVLDIISTDSQVSAICLAHPLLSIWPKIHAGPCHVLERLEAWKVLGKTTFMVQLRLTAIGNTIDAISATHDTIRSLETANALEHLVFFSYDTTVSVDVCTDLLDFASSETLHPDTSAEALNKLTTWMATNMPVMSRLLVVFVERESEGTTEILSRLFLRVLASDNHESSHTRSNIIIECASTAAETSDISKQIFLDAGILVLMFAILPNELTDSSIFPTSVTTNASRLLNTIRDLGVEHLFWSGTGAAFSHGQQVLLRAFRDFFGFPVQDVVRESGGNVRINRRQNMEAVSSLALFAAKIGIRNKPRKYTGREPSVPETVDEEQNH